jgi:hypothetical protein
MSLLSITFYFPPPNNKHIFTDFPREFTGSNKAGNYV